MRYFNCINHHVSQFKWYHISSIKASTFAFTLLVAKLWPPILSLQWGIYILLTLVASIPLIWRMIQTETQDAKEIAA